MFSELRTDVHKLIGPSHHPDHKTNAETQRLKRLFIDNVFNNIYRETWRSVTECGVCKFHDTRIIYYGCACTVIIFQGHEGLLRGVNGNYRCI